jgi:hypothetical protein
MLQGRGRPPLTKQRETLRAHGVDVDDEFGLHWLDVIERGRPGPNSGRSQLTARNDLLRAAQEGDRVVVAAPYCLGISPDDAAWFIEALTQAGVSLVISGEAKLVAPGDDTKEVLAEIARQQNTANVAAYRKRRVQ